MKRLFIFCIFILFLLITTSCSPSIKPATEIPVATATPKLVTIKEKSTQTDPAESTPSSTPTQPLVTLKPTRTPILPTATPTLFPEFLTHFLTDETGAITINVPTLWTEQQTLSWLDSKGKEIGTIFIVATDVEKFLELEAEGVAISASKRLPIGYIELLDSEVPNYLSVCKDTYHTRWNINTNAHRGKEAVLSCHDSSYEWLTIMSMVNKSDPSAYIARIIGFDMIPIFGEDFRTMLREFEVDSSLLP